MRTAAIILLLSIFVTFQAAAQSAAPVLFYTDIDSGPATGGEGGTDGAFVCVYGENFGSSQGTSSITIGGVAAAQYKLWMDPGAPYQPGTAIAKACVQLSHLTASGLQNVQLTTAQGISNTLPFTVRPGNIWWVTTSGNDTAASGSQAHPWASIAQCKNQMAAGDICLIGNGVTVNSMENWEAAVWLNSSGSAGSPKAIVAYPAANVSIAATVASGNWAATGQLQGINNYSGGTATCGTAGCSYWTIAGLSQINGSNGGIALLGGSNIRLVDNDIVCEGAYCDGGSGGLATSTANLAIYGNRFHDIGCHDDVNYESSAHPCAWSNASVTLSTTGTSFKLSGFQSGLAEGDVIQAAGQLRRIVSCTSNCLAGTGTGLLDVSFSADLAAGSTFQYRDFVPQKVWHNVYIGNHSNSVQFAWNNVDGSVGKACRGVLFNATKLDPSTGFSLYDLHVHDNFIHDTVCDGVTFATVDPSQGTVEAYNNVVYNAGEGNGSTFNGGDPIPLPSYYACIYSAGVVNNGNPGTGSVLVYNNTLYNCGSRVLLQNVRGLTGAIAVAPGSAPTLFVLASNNIIYAADPNEIYLEDYFGLAGSGICQGVTSYCSGASSNNVFFGSTASVAPTYFANNILTNPKFAMAPSDFRLFSGNPASGASTAGLASANDLDGIARNSTNPTPGAYEYIPGASTAARALIPTITTVTVSSNPQIPGAPANFRILVAPNSGTAIPSGQVAIYDDAVKVAQLSLDGSGEAYLSDSGLSLGNHTITTYYLGDLNFSTSNAAMGEMIGEGIPSLSKTTFSFSAPLNIASAAQTATLTNLGSVPLAIGSFALSSTEFAVTSNNCSPGGTPVTLAPGASCSFSLIFQPTVVSAVPRSVKLSISFTTAASTQVIMLDGFVIVPTYSLSTTSLLFNSVVGVASANQTVTLSNTSEAPLTINSVTIPTVYPFTVTSNTCVPGSSPTIVGIGDSCTFAVSFKPILGSLTQRGILTVSAAPLAVSKIASLTGTVAPPTYTLSASSLSFAEQLVGTSSQPLTIVLTNTSPLASLTIQSMAVPSGWINVAGAGSCLSPVTLAHGTNCSISIAFRPTSAGAKSGQLKIMVAAPGTSQAVSLSGTGVAAISFFPATIVNYGLVVPGTSKTLTLTLTNPATNPPLSNIAVGFTGSAKFARSTTSPGTCGTTLPNSTTAVACTINIVYAPVSTEVQSAIDTGTVTITGSLDLIPQSHIVSLLGTAE